MLDSFRIISALVIFAASVAGAWLPLSSRNSGKQVSFPMGEAFSSGVFLALSQFMMLPAATAVLHRSMPVIRFPIAPLLAVLSFLALLAISHILQHLQGREAKSTAEHKRATLPIIMTLMIAFPSFFMGTAIAVSPFEQALLIVAAVLMHKSSAAFALALKMVDSAMTRKQAWIALCLFATSTPLGIVVGEVIKSLTSGETILIIRGTVLAMASGTFLFMAVLHDLQDNALIRHCRTKRGFLWMLAGLALTASVRYLIGEAHHIR